MPQRQRTRRPQSRPLRRQDIRKTSRATAAALAVSGLHSCLFGSAACSMYGMTRVPNDVDIIVLTELYDQEEVKNLLVENDSNFFLVRSSRPRATYKILYYTLPSRGFCKVDILLPGILDIPAVPRSRITYTQVPDVPVMPLIAVLLLKLQGWTDHRDSEREDFQEKQYMDVDDIKEMLDILRWDYGMKTLSSEDWMPRWFVNLARERVDEFVEVFPDTRDHWCDIGFNI